MPFVRLRLQKKKEGKGERKGRREQLSFVMPLLLGEKKEKSWNDPIGSLTLYSEKEGREGRKRGEGGTSPSSNFRFSLLSGRKKKISYFFPRGKRKVKRRTRILLSSSLTLNRRGLFSTHYNREGKKRGIKEGKGGEEDQ